jgi:hypothetical protein
MVAKARFAGLPADFWAYVKALSEKLGYSERGKKSLKRHSAKDVRSCLAALDLSPEPLSRPLKGRSSYLTGLVAYLNYRATALEEAVEPRLMNREQAQMEFERLKGELDPHCALPMNKQKGEKRHEAYLTCIVNMLTEHALGGCHFDDDPRRLITVQRDGQVLLTLSRRLDGAYPSATNPVALWEVKEYYGTTTFGSRIADGVYETALDGHELAGLRAREDVCVLHYLMVDDYFTWWDCGRSYLCRIVDMLHEGLLDEVLYGREVIDRWPNIVREWPDSLS